MVDEPAAAPVAQPVEAQAPAEAPPVTPTSDEVAAGYLETAAKARGLLGDAEATAESGATQPAEPGEAAVAAASAAGQPQATSEPEPPALSQSEAWAHISRLDREKRELQDQLKSNAALRAQVESDPLAALDTLGLPLDRILDAYAGSTKATPEPAAGAEAQPGVAPELVAQIKALTDQVAEMKKGAETSARDRAVNDQLARIGEIAGTQNGEGPKYELIQQSPDTAHPLILETAGELVRMHNLKITAQNVDQLYAIAADNVEEHLQAENDARIDALSRTRRYKSRFATAAGPAQPTAQAEPAAPTIGATAGDTPAPRELSEEERMAGVVERFYSRLTGQE